MDSSSLARDIASVSVLHPGSLYAQVPGISLQAVRELAHRHACGVGAVERCALQQGVCPERYRRNLGTIGIDGQLALLNSRVAVIGAGHYPLLDHARAAVAVFHQAQRRLDGPRPIAWAFTGYELLRDEGLFSPCGDPAGKWETSLLMALDPGMQDLATLPEDRGIAPVGASNNGVQDANAAWGRAAVDAIVGKVRTRVTDFLEHPERIGGHGAPM